MNYKNDISKTKVVILDESPLMKKLVYDLFANDAGIDIIGIFKDYTNMRKFLYDLSYMADCIIVSLNEREDILNILIELKKYGFNVMFITNIDLNITTNIREIVESNNITIIPYLGKLNLNIISQIKDQVLKEVYRIKNIRIKRVLLNPDRAIVIASSTGGPKVIEYIFSKIRTEVDMPIFIVQHMPSGCTKQFADRLRKVCNFDFCEGMDREIIKSNVVYVAPSGYHMQISGKQIFLDQNDFVNNVRPSADVLFKSASKVYKEGLLGIVLTGMGKDASMGVQEIKKRGGITVAQNEISCAVFGMPKSAIETGKIDKVLSIDDIVIEILKHSGKV